MFTSVGGSEILVILVVALILFGADKLPELARGLGKGMHEFRKASENLKSEIENGVNEIYNEFREASEGFKNEIEDGKNSLNDAYHSTVDQDWSFYEDDEALTADDEELENNGEWDEENNDEWNEEKEDKQDNSNQN
jgi:sec-independent protein translocase protein TatA